MRGGPALCAGAIPMSRPRDADADDGGCREVRVGCRWKTRWCAGGEHGAEPWGVGPATIPVRAQSPGGTIIVGARFRPGHAQRWLAVPANEMLDSHMPWHVAKDVRPWAEYGGKPLSGAPAPDSLLFPAAGSLTRVKLDGEIGRQSIDGRWRPNWLRGQYPEACAVRRWRGRGGSRWTRGDRSGLRCGAFPALARSSGPTGVRRGQWLGAEPPSSTVMAPVGLAVEIGPVSKGEATRPPAATRRQTRRGSGPDRLERSATDPSGRERPRRGGAAESAPSLNADHCPRLPRDGTRSLAARCRAVGVRDGFAYNVGE